MKNRQAYGTSKEASHLVMEDALITNLDHINDCVCRRLCDCSFAASTTYGTNATLYQGTSNHRKGEVLSS
jgi:hypothetical protein